MNNIVMVLAGMFALSSCTKQSNSVTPPDGLTIRTGTSYGMCVGYCRTEYAIDRSSTVLTISGNGSQPQSPPKTCGTVTSAAAWTALGNVVNFDTFSKLPERIGCPDCADGGAEFVELQLGDSKHRVTFEAGQTIPGFESLVEQLRQQRTLLSTCP